MVGLCLPAIRTATVCRQWVRLPWGLLSASAPLPAPRSSFGTCEVCDGEGGCARGGGMVVAVGTEACRRAQRFELVCR